MKKKMKTRFATGLALLCMTLPLTACSGGDDDSSSTNTDTKTNAWSGHTYLLALKSRDWTVPRGIGMDLYGIAPSFIFKVTGSGNNLTATLATGPGTYPDPADATNPLLVTPTQAMQDPCDVTSDIPFDGSKYPSATIAPSAKIPMFVRNTAAKPMPLQVTADVYNLKFTDVLPNGSTPSTSGTLEASMDFRQLYILFALLGANRDKDSVCASLASHYSDPSTGVVVQCEPCPDGQPYCLSVKAEGIGAVEAPNLVVNEMSAASRPGTCADSPPPM
jgi:hypothetical protein